MAELRKPILETGNLKHLMIIDLICYIILTILASIFCFVKFRCVRRLMKKGSRDAPNHALVLITGISILANSILRIGACSTYMAIQYSSLVPTSPHVNDYLMAPLYFEIGAFPVFFCTFSYLIFAWWHIIGGLKRIISDYSVRKLVYYALGIAACIFPLFIPNFAMMPVRWNTDTTFVVWLALVLLPVGCLSIAMAACVAFFGYKMVKKAREASKGNKITSSRLIIFASAFSIALLTRLVGLPFIAAATGTEAVNYNISQILFVLLPDLIPYSLYLYIQSRAHYYTFVKPPTTAAKSFQKTAAEEKRANEENTPAKTEDHTNETEEKATSENDQV